MFVRYGKSVFGLRGNEGERIFVGLSSGGGTVGSGVTAEGVCNDENIFEFQFFIFNMLSVYLYFSRINLT